MKFQNKTKIRPGELRGGSNALHGRWYEDACAAAFAMELLGERWSLLIMRELMMGPRRFSQIRASLPGISAKVLTERLETLADAGALQPRMLPPPASVQVYELTPWGYEAEAVMQALGRWAVRSPRHDPTLPLSPVSAMLSLRTMIDPAAARALDAVVDFALGADRFVARLANGELAVARSDAPTPDADLSFTGESANAILPFFYGNVSLAQAEAQFGLRFTGDPVLAERFASLFSLPPKNADCDERRG